MLLAGHAETMRNGDVILSAELLTRIYRAMAARQPKPRVSWACPVCAASVILASRTGYRLARHWHELAGICPGCQSRNP